MIRGMHSPTDPGTATGTGEGSTTQEAARRRGRSSGSSPAPSERLYHGLNDLLNLIIKAPEIHARAFSVITPGSTPPPHADAAEKVAGAEKGKRAEAARTKNLKDNTLHGDSIRRHKRQRPVHDNAATAPPPTQHHATRAATPRAGLVSLQNILSPLCRGFTAAERPSARRWACPNHLSGNRSAQQEKQTKRTNDDGASAITRWKTPTSANRSMAHQHKPCPLILQQPHPSIHGRVAAHRSDSKLTRPRDATHASADRTLKIYKIVHEPLSFAAVVQPRSTARRWPRWRRGGRRSSCDVAEEATAAPKRSPSRSDGPFRIDDEDRNSACMSDTSRAPARAECKPRNEQAKLVRRLSATWHSLSCVCSFLATISSDSSTVRPDRPLEAGQSVTTVLPRRRWKASA